MSGKYTILDIFHLSIFKDLTIESYLIIYPTYNENVHSSELR